MNECQALYPDDMSGDEDEAGEDEEAIEENAEDGDEQNGYEENYYETNPQNFADFEENNGEFYTAANIDQNDIELSDRGLEVLRRLNINFQTSIQSLILKH